MDAQMAIDMGRQAILVTLLVSAPVLAAGMGVGLLVGLFQALTHIQEQSVAFVPKIVFMILTLSLTLPWLVARMLDYAQGVISNIPETL